MNATDFIKQHGVDKAREIVEGAPVVIDGTDKPFTATHYNYHPRAPIDYINNDGTVIPLCFMEVNFPSYWIDLSDLKRLVESVELVEHFGNDLVGAKQLLGFSNDCKTIELSGSVITVERLKQAIADYESIGGEHV